MAIELLEQNTLIFTDPIDGFGLLPRVEWVETVFKTPLLLEGSFRNVGVQSRLVFKQFGEHIKDGKLIPKTKFERNHLVFNENGNYIGLGHTSVGRCLDVARFTVRCSQDERSTPELIGKLSEFYESLYYREMNELATSQDMMQEIHELA